ncbi:hypothetical protein WR25_26580 [Diploscapter pachys]|uniref:Exostosin GT47 domain-containing protein n=1 Tax=Diploscapter pachys TaxID=2018661 RepID=A0A2A2KUU4_9BILA|nr:hypothetical protein WR25_26580 [Diploscapter pachys]
MSFFQESFETRAAECEKTSFYTRGEYFRCISDYSVYDTKDAEHLKVLQIHNRSIMFIKEDFVCSLKLFQKHNRKSYILISHDSDYAVPFGLCGTSGEELLADPYLIRWYSTNTDVFHPKLETIPIGIGNAKYKHGNLPMLLDAVRTLSKPYDKRETNLFAAFSLGTHPDRGKIFNATCTNKDLNAKCFDPNQLATWDVFLKEMGNSRFVLSPRGNGIDCHRTWESIIMGSVPIVPNSSIRNVYVGERVLVVDDLTKLNATFLEERYNYFKNAIFAESRIFSRYWMREISKLLSQN